MRPWIQILVLTKGGERKGGRKKEEERRKGRKEGRKEGKCVISYFWE
jgi:hypothetical protein